MEHLTDSTPAPETFIQELHRSQLRRSRPSDSWGELNVEWVDLRRLKIGLGYFVPFVSRMRGSSPKTKAEFVETQLIAFVREKAGNSPTVYLSDDPSFEIDRAQSRMYFLAVVRPNLRIAFVEAQDLEERYRILGSALAADIGPEYLSRRICPVGPHRVRVSSAEAAY